MIDMKDPGNYFDTINYQESVREDNNTTRKEQALAEDEIRRIAEDVGLVVRVFGLRHFLADAQSEYGAEKGHVIAKAIYEDGITYDLEDHNQQDAELIGSIVREFARELLEGDE